MYDMSRGVVINVFDPPPAEPVELSGVQFTFSQLSPSPNLITQISFMSSLEMNGRILTCESIIDNTQKKRPCIGLTYNNQFLHHCLLD